jgi:amidohydrolase
MQFTISGHGGHAARPHETRDPIAAAAQLINALYLYIPRVTDSQDAVVITIGQIQGGENANVIPETVTLKGTLRSLDRGVRQKTMEHVRRLALGIGEMTQTRIETTFGLGANSVNNDAFLISLLERAGVEILGKDGVQRIQKPSMGSEDFAFYLDHVPGAMLRLGCSSATHGGAPLHTSVFDIDERAIAIGAKVLARALVYRALAAVENHDEA